MLQWVYNIKQEGALKVENGALANLNNVINTHNNEKTVDYLAKFFRSHGLNKATPNLVFAKLVELDRLSRAELICLAEGLYNITGVESIDPKQLFEKEEIMAYTQAQDKMDYYPTTIAAQRTLDYRDRKILDFLNETYGNYKTKHTYFFIYDTKIRQEERENEKQLGDFDAIEIVTLMQSMKGSLSTRKNALSLVKKYMNWYWRENPEENPMLDIEKNTPLVIVNDSHLSSKYIPVDELEDISTELTTTDDNSVFPIDGMIAALIRQGLTAKEVANLRFADFNFQNGTVKVKTNGAGIKLVKLDPHVLHWVMETREDNRPVGHPPIYLNIVDDHIIRIPSSTYNVDKAVENIRRRLAKFKNAGYKPLSESVLIMSKKIDLLDNIVATQGVVTKDDFIKVQEMFGNKGSSWFKIRTEYEAVRGAKHIRL